MNDKKYSALIVDDHRIVSAMLRKILSDIPCIGVATISDSGHRALSMMNEIEFDLCLVDLELPDISGIELIEQMRSKSPKTKIIVCTMHTELWILEEVGRLNVEGMINKDAEIDEYRRTVVDVLSGKSRYCERFIAATQQPAQAERRLSRVEVSVLKLLIKGMTTKEIADQLYRSVNTIDTHRRHIMKKLGAKNIAQIVNKAHALGYDFGSTT